MRLVQGDEGGGRLKTGEEVNRLNRRTQQTLPCLTALLRKKEARPGLACLVEKKRAARAAAHGGMVDGVRGAPGVSSLGVVRFWRNGLCMLVRNNSMLLLSDTVWIKALAIYKSTAVGGKVQNLCVLAAAVAVAARSCADQRS
jgi:hypothetical protein